MKDIELSNITEKIILKNQSLFSFYLHCYNRNYKFNEKIWPNFDEKRLLFNLFESIVLNENDIFKLYPIIQFNPISFQSLISDSKVLKNNEDITIMIDIIKDQNVKFKDFETFFEVEINQLKNIIKEQDDKIKDLELKVSKIGKGVIW